MTTIDIMKTSLASLILGIASLHAQNQKIRLAIAHAESDNRTHAIGDNGKAFGAYQMHKVAWDDANSHRKAMGMEQIPWSRKMEREAQDQMVESFVSITSYRFFAAYARAPLPSEVYMAYTMGFSAAKRIGFKPSAMPDKKKQALRRFMTALLRIEREEG